MHNPTIIAKIQDIVLENCRLNQRGLIEAPRLSLGSMSDSLAEVLGFSIIFWNPLGAAFANNGTISNATFSATFEEFSKNGSRVLVKGLNWRILDTRSVTNTNGDYRQF